MVLNVTALGFFAAAVVAGLLILRRHLPRPGAATRLVCVRCGSPAADLGSFTCPGCGHDVRGMGLAPSRGRSPTRPFWEGPAFTAALCFATVFASGVLQSSTRRSRHFHQESSMSGGGDSPVMLLKLSLSGRGKAYSHEAPPDARLVGDLIATDGGYAQLELDAGTERWTLTAPASGSAPESGRGITEEMARLWFTMACLDPTETKTHDAMIECLDEVRRATGRPQLPIQRRAPGTRFNSRSGSSTASIGAPPESMAAVLMVGSAVWLLGLWLIVRRTPRQKAGRQAPAPAGARTEPAPAAGGAA